MNRTTVSLTGWLLLAWCVIAAPAATGAVPWPMGGDGLPTLAPMLEQVQPAVVNISTRSRIQAPLNPLYRDPFFRRFFGEPQLRPSQSLGSGVIVDAEQGYVLTNHHVVEDADEITVTMHDGRTFDADLIGSDPETDVAVIRIPDENLTALDTGDSDALRVGDFVVAIGSPFGLQQTVTSGIVSALGRSGLGIEGYEDFIQTDASINPGNSGGALVNLRGELVGINTAILAPGGGNVGIGFAIPVNMARNLMQQLVEHGEVQRGRLGVMVQDLTPELAQAFDINQSQGAVISRVLPESAAADAGLREGDVVTSVNGVPVENGADLRNTIGLARAGESIELGVMREGKAKRIRATIKALEAQRQAGAQISPRLDGALFSDAETDAADPTRKGVKVVEVEPGSPAWNAGLREEDIIVSANRRPVNTIDDLRAAVRLNPKALLMNIKRGDGALFLVIR